MSTKLSAGRVPLDVRVHQGQSRQVQPAGDVSRARRRPGCYELLAHPNSDRAQEDARLLRLIRASFTASQGIYGAPRVFLDLREAGEPCSKHRVTRLMRVSQLRAARLSNTALVDRQAICFDPQPPVAAVHGDAAQQGVGHRYHLHSDMAGLALPGCRHGSVLARDHRLVGRTDHSPRPCGIATAEQL